MGSKCCSQSDFKEPPLKIQASDQPLVPTKPESEAGHVSSELVCTEWSHVESLLGHLPADVHASLEDKVFQQRCHQSFRDIVAKREQGNSKDPEQLEWDELSEAVHRSVPDTFMKNRLHTEDISKLILAFDMNSNGRISKGEFVLFCMWCVAMDVMGFFAGTTPFARIANEVAATHLLIISEYLDPEHILGNCALPTTACAYYHPDGITLDEFSAQLESAAHIRTQKGVLFESVALANHGPDEDGRWNVCADFPVSLRSLDSAWPRLMPLFHALADMVSTPTRPGYVDLLACHFAANQTGLQCLEMIESQVNAKFAASTDATGNVAAHGNWLMERGGRNVAPVYFHEERLKDFTKVMAAPPPAKKRCPPKNNEPPPFVTDVEDIQWLKGGNTEKDKQFKSTMDIQEMMMPVLNPAIPGLEEKPPSSARSARLNRMRTEDASHHKISKSHAAASTEEAPSRKSARGRPKAKAKRSPPVCHKDVQEEQTFV